ncbi:unnamed protein product [Cochlearia groenlandica]
MLGSSFSIFCFLLLLVGSSPLFSPVTGDLSGDKQALLDFLNNIIHPRALTWNASSPVCTTWSGVTCDRDGTRVTGLHLPGASLIGVIPPQTISRLSELQILSLRSNGLQGPFPIDFLQLKKLKAISLSHNRFTGSLPLDYATWKNLTVLDLFGNRLNGSIPAGLANLTGLVSLNLAKNSFSGQIPNLDLFGLRRLNFSSNNLTGSIPKSLQRFGKSAFLGNNLIYENAPPPVGSPREEEKEKENRGIYISEPAILGIAIGGCFLIFFLIAILIITCYVKRQRRQEPESEKRKPAKTNRQNIPSEKEVSKLRREKNIEDMKEKSEFNKVMFFEGSNHVFNLEDLLIASAEFLGKGTFGMTYKAALNDSKVVAVKRLKDVVVSRKDFKHQMDIVGNISHANVAPLRAYVCSKEEKLMVYDYYPKGSLYVLLHGKNGDEGSDTLNWETRLRFLIGLSKGLAHIHTKHKLAHGNIKSSNVFLNSIGYGCISETGLALLTNPVTRTETSAKHVIRYRAPEVTDTRRSTPESDIYGFGILMLETLTGKSSLDNENEPADLVAWVNMVLVKQWTGEVFDLVLLKTPNIEPKLLQMIDLGLDCTNRVPTKRPEMVKVVEMLEDIERDYMLNYMKEKSEFNKVMFFEGSNLVFNLEDLLIASAEFLGKGTFGMTYKAALNDSKVVAVKRLKDVVVSRKDFKHQMDIVGNISHANVAPLRAYVCSKEEKLMVYDYYPKGSLYVLLHGKNGDEGSDTLNWETRLRFLIGLSKGLAHIHTKHKLAHGNIKSSNVFLNSIGYGCISETGLALLTNPVTRTETSAKHVIRYRAPEVTDTRRSTPESDIYGFGILMLETLTGKSSLDNENEPADLVAWVNTVLEKQWIGEVFDLVLLKTPNIEPKLLQMIDLGLDCTNRVPTKRPEMVKVVEMLEDIERDYMLNC